MAKMEIGTLDATVHTKATQLGIKHTHGIRHYYSNSYAWFDLEVEDQVAIAKGFEIGTNDYVIFSVSETNEDLAKLLMEANFDSVFFLNKLAAYNQTKAKEAEEHKLKRQRKEEEEQQQKLALQNARGLLAQEFRNMERQIDTLNTNLDSKNERISSLEGWLEKLIKASSEPALTRAGLVMPQVDEEEEELTQEQQEALRTSGLDC